MKRCRSWSPSSRKKNALAHSDSTEPDRRMPLRGSLAAFRRSGASCSEGQIVQSRKQVVPFRLFLCDEVGRKKSVQKSKLRQCVHYRVPALLTPPTQRNGGRLPPHALPGSDHRHHDCVAFPTGKTPLHGLLRMQTSPPQRMRHACSARRLITGRSYLARALASWLKNDLVS